MEKNSTIVYRAHSIIYLAARSIDDPQASNNPFTGRVLTKRYGLDTRVNMATITIDILPEDQE